MFIKEVNSGGTQYNIVKWNIIINESHLQNLIKSRKKRRSEDHVTCNHNYILAGLSPIHIVYSSHLSLLIFCSYPFVFFFLYSNLIFIFYPFLNFEAPLSFGSTPTTTPNFYHFKPAMFTNTLEYPIQTFD